MHSYSILVMAAAASVQLTHVGAKGQPRARLPRRLDEEDGELGDFIHAMMDGVQASMEGQRANDANDVDHFASPSRRR